MSELVKQLRKDADFVDAVTYDGCWEVKETERGQRLRAAASRIEALESRERALREALEPFAAQTRGSSLTEEAMILRARAALAGDAP